MPPHIFLLLPILFWSGNYILGRMAVTTGVDPFTVSFFRWSLACLIILPFAWRPLKRDWPIIRNHLPFLILLGWLGVCNYNLLLYVGLSSTNVTNAVLLNSLMPIMILLAARLLLGNRTSLTQNLGILLSTTGALVIVSRGHLENLATLTVSQGDIWILIAAVSWALYSVLVIKRPEGLSILGLFASTALIGTSIQWPLFLFFGHQDWSALTLMDWGTFLYMALFASIGAFICWNMGVQKLGAATAGQFIHLLPVFSISLSALILGERLQGFHYGGIALIFGGILVATRKKNTSASASVNRPR